MPSARSRVGRDALAAWAVAVGLLAAIFWVSHQPRPPVPLLFRHSDKLLHAVAYAALALSCYTALRVTWPWHGYRWHAWIAGTMAAAYGATDEWHQTFVPGRVASIEDWGFDAGGAFAVALLAATIKRARVEPVQ